MVLPSYMTGKEKREKMAVMETAISSSLSHPNVVQTYTYAVEPVRSNTTLSDRSHASGPGASISMHDSTLSWAAEKKPARDGDEQTSEQDGSGAGTPGCWLTYQLETVFDCVHCSRPLHDGVLLC